VYEYLLKGVMLERFTTSQRAKPFVLQKGILYRFGQDNKFRPILQPKLVSTILQELHGGTIKRHFFFDITMRKFMDAGYWWLMLNLNVHEYCQTCDQCQRIGKLLTQNLAKISYYIT
jgi:hypothetical protein